MQDLGIDFLRYGPPIHTTWLGEGRYDWRFSDETFADLKRRDIVPIVDLCHFGVPDWIGDFQNPDFPELFQRYARDFAVFSPSDQEDPPVLREQATARANRLALDAIALAALGEPSSRQLPLH